MVLVNVRQYNVRIPEKTNVIGLECLRSSSRCHNSRGIEFISNVASVNVDANWIQGAHCIYQIECFLNAIFRLQPQNPILSTPFRISDLCHMEIRNGGSRIQDSLLPPGAKNRDQSSSGPTN